MKYMIISAVLILLVSCNQTGADKTIVKDTAVISKPGTSKQPVDAGNTIENDSTILFRKASDILTAAKSGDYQSFATFIHPQLGCRFSPFAYVDTAKDKKLSANEFIAIEKQNKKINWNSAFSEEVELLTVKQYFSKFVYDADFMNAEFKSLNKFHNAGTDLNNIQEVYPQHNIIELFFPGFEKKYEGMDFKGLRLVFKSWGTIPYLVAVVHHQWTP